MKKPFGTLKFSMTLNKEILLVFWSIEDMEHIKPHTQRTGKPLTTFFDFFLGIRDG